jgi:hypothetical protein
MGKGADMARIKRGSKVLNKVAVRIAGMRSLSDSLDFGGDLTLATYDAKIQNLQAQLNRYNTLLSEIDGLSESIVLAEKDLSYFAERMLLGVATQYGRDSVQYMQAGGTIRKFGKRKPSAPQPPAASLLSPQPPAEKIATNGHAAPVTLN